MTSTVSAQSHPISLLDWGLILLLGGLWGGSFFFARVAVAEIAPLELVLYRVGIAALALNLYLVLRGVSLGLLVTHGASFLAMGLINNVLPFSLMFAGQTELGAGLASVLNATTPFWTMLLANALTEEKLTVRKLAGVALGLLGTTVMVGPGLLAGLGGPVWAKLALVGTALCYACALVFAKRFKGLKPELVASGQLTASTLIMLPIVMGLYGLGGMASASAPVMGSVLGLALASTAFAYVIYFRILASAGPTNASLVTFIVPVSAILLGTLFLRETMEMFEIAGMMLIAAGLVVIDGRLLRAFGGSARRQKI